MTTLKCDNSCIRGNTLVFIQSVVSARQWAKHLSIFLSCLLLSAWSSNALTNDLTKKITRTLSIQDLKCLELTGLNSEDVTIDTLEVVEKSELYPEFCKVAGVIKPSIGFEIRLPTQDWNGKFYMAGCGGFCGRLGNDAPSFVNAMNYGLTRGYAVSTMDSGHKGTGSTDAEWALNNRQGEIDWGHRAVHETAVLTKKAIAAYFGNGPKKSYFAGCSTGGRMAAMEASRYPEDFDGVISGAPALNYTNLVATYMAWVVQKNTDEYGKPIITSDDLSTIIDGVNDTCDLDDGVEDDIIENPLLCKFKPEQLLCKKGQSEKCLSQKQVETLEAFYAGPSNSKGEPLYTSGIPVGSESSWRIWITGAGSKKDDEISRRYSEKMGAMYAFNRNFLRYMAFEEDPGESMSSMDFDFDKDPEKLEYMGKIYNADTADLTEFKKRGGKMLIWHGWADAIIPASSSIDYFHRIVSVNGGFQPTIGFTRLFMMPGTDHCAAFPAPGYHQDGFDLLTALENWVEKNQPPVKVTLTKFDKDKSVKWQRPSCLYPLSARYNGKGDPTKEENFSCAMPGR